MTGEENKFAQRRQQITRLCMLWNRVVFSQSKYNILEVQKSGEWEEWEREHVCVSRWHGHWAER